MSKTVTIPSDVSRMEIIINNKTYTYAGGATVTVPDEVAALIANNAANKPQGKRPVENPLGNDGLYEGTDFIPVYTDKDGGMRIRKEDVSAAMASEIAAIKQPFRITFTIKNNAVTADKTAAQIKTAITGGQEIYGVYSGIELSMVDYTITSNNLTAITLQGFGVLATDTLTVRTFSYASSAWSTDETTYALTETT